MRGGQGAIRPGKQVALEGLVRAGRLYIEMLSDFNFSF